MKAPSVTSGNWTVRKLPGADLTIKIRSDEVDICYIAPQVEHEANARLLSQSKRLADALNRKVNLHYDVRQHDKGVDLNSFTAWLEESSRAHDEAVAALLASGYTEAAL